MAINFPLTPTLNQTYTFNGRTWTWNSVGWQAVGNNSSTGVFTTVAVGGATLGANALAVTGTAAFSGAVTTAALSATTLASSVANAGGLTQEAVIAPTLLNGWVNYGSGYITAGYFKDSQGIVHLQGLIKSGTATAATAVFTLPVGYRPTLIEIFPTISNSVFCALQVRDNGNVEFAIAGNTAYVSLSGISFRQGN
jgi:hypothetical protein